MGREKRALLPWVSSEAPEFKANLRREGAGAESREAGGEKSARGRERQASSLKSSTQSVGQGLARFLHFPLIPGPQRDPINRPFLSSEEDVYPDPWAHRTLAKSIAHPKHTRAPCTHNPICSQGTPQHTPAPHSHTARAQGQASVCSLGQGSEGLEGWRRALIQRPRGPPAVWVLRLRLVTIS